MDCMNRSSVIWRLDVTATSVATEVALEDTPKVLKKLPKSLETLPKLG